MRIEKENISVTRSGDFEETKFRIKASPKAFDILSSKLYSDPYLAIVRELSTNAWDAHIEAGTLDKPFEVHLPNRMEPFFYIRDFGTGLSHKDILNLYTTYFESTKTETNKQAGCWGIGSKVPFSYTDNFSVTSWFQGKKRIYSMFKGEEGFPKVALMQTIDSDEHSGIEVRFACDVNDIETFIEKAKRVYRRFQTRPKFYGCSKIDLEDKKIFLSGRNWKCFEDNNISYAIMGPIAYPIKSYHFDREVYNLFCNAGIEISLPIGSLEIAANREELQYSDLTKENLNKAAKLINKEIIQKIEEKFKKCQTLWEARVLFAELFKYNGPFSSLRDNIGKMMKWKNQSCYLPYNSQLYIGGLAEISRYRIMKDCNSNLTVRRHNNIKYIDCKSNTQLMINDLDSDPGSRIRNWMKNEGLGIESVYLISNELIEETEDSLHKTLGTTPELFMRTSTLPKPKRVKSKRTSSGKKNKIPIASRGFIFNRSTLSWNQEIIDINNPGIYVAWLKNQAKYGNVSISLAGLKDILDGLQVMKTKPDKLYAFKNGYVFSVLKKEPKWKHLFEYAEECLDLFIKTNKLEEKTALKISYQNLSDKNKFMAIAKQITNKDSPMKKFEALVLKAESINDKVDAAIKVGQQIGFKFKLGKICLLTEKDKLEEKYPLLKYINYYSFYRKECEEIKESTKYVNIVDGYNKQNIGE